MSSTTEITLNFSNLTSLEITLDSGAPALSFGIAQNQQETWLGQSAMDLIYSMKFQNSLGVWKRNLVNLMWGEELNTQEMRAEFQAESEDKYQAVSVIIRHIR